jgi:multiple sugar transport system permease protein
MGGAANYVRIATADPKFAAAMKVTLTYVVFLGAVQADLRAAVAMAAQPRHARPAALSRHLLPAIAARRAAWRSPCCGASCLPATARQRGPAQIGIEGPSWISHPSYSLYTLVALSVWQFGSPMIIFLAGLRQIPQDMYEAASLDGASNSGSSTRSPCRC